jgi:predicted transposase/invertase (TIGR01784 family)
LNCLFKPESRIEKKTQVKWLKYLSQIDERTVTVDPELAQDAESATALEMVKVAALSAADIELYHDREDKARIEATVVEDAKQQGQVEGGITRALAIAKNLLVTGMDAASVAAATQLPISEVEALKR